MKFHESPCIGSRVVPCAQRETDMTKLIVAFRNFAIAPKIALHVHVGLRVACFATPYCEICCCISAVPRGKGGRSVSLRRFISLRHLTLKALQDFSSSQRRFEGSWCFHLEAHAYQYESFKLPIKLLDVSMLTYLSCEHGCHPAVDCVVFCGAIS